MKLRVYRIDRGSNWYLFLSVMDVARTIDRLQPGETKLTISEMTAEEYCKAAPGITNAPDEHLNAVRLVPGSTDR